MKRLLGIIVLSLFLSTNAFSKYGKGEIKLSEGMMEYFLEYIYGGTKNLDPGTGGGTTNKNMKSVPKLFTVNVSGTYATVNYCPMGINCRPSNKSQAIMRCEKRGETCYTFAVGKKIVWKNNKNPKGLNLRKELKHGSDHVARIIIDGGYHDGNISSKTINTSASKITKKKKESKKVVKKYELKGERSIALSWDGYEDLIAGTVEFDEADYKGTLNLPLPNNDGTCDGTYSLQEGGKGTWQIACTNNMGAAGTLKWTKNGGVTGSGRDHNDKKVKFTVSKKG